jgi:membrane dipeptidase
VGPVAIERFRDVGDFGLLGSGFPPMCYSEYFLFVSSRRTFLSTVALAAGAPLVNRITPRVFAASLPEYSTRAADLVHASTVIDMLGLVTLDFKRLYDWQQRPEGFQDSDFQRLKDSGITIFHPAVGFTGGDIYTSSYRDITRWNLFIAARPHQFLRIDSLDDLERVKNSGKIGILIGQQNSAHFRSVGDVDQFYQMGQRVSQLTYDPNRIGGGSSNPQDSGLTEYGAAIIERMNQVGMAIDVSHCADRTTLEAIEASRKPVLITHSNCRALVPNSARCKTDEAIRKMAAKDGVMGVTMIRSFVRPQGAASVEDVLDHIGRIAQLVGVEHVGLGTDVDLDGWDGRAPAQRSYVSGVLYAKKVFALTEGLIRRNYSNHEIELILGGNFQRVLSRIWAA